ncbi:tyrosine-type recombinase/integrase [Cereibacter sphaeroides]|uniref:tyrosine-type recombinase/integrase n=1 Tax=Cereibacter sphaeroides TaxID=1063 RepID=UPI000191C1B9|nr:site-specific integrase [Cereibacter sphaeroides]ACM02186.1 phage-related integrase [Cereibacter sphaeroides KD131]
MKKPLNDSFVRALEVPTDGRLEVSDTVRPGLRLRIYPNGRKVWSFEKRIKGGPKRKHLLGTYPDTSIKEARAAALEIELEASKGVDRVAEAEKAKLDAEERKRKAVLVADVVEAHRALHLANLRSQRDRLRTLKEALAPHMDQPVRELRRADLQAAIDRKAAAGALIQANRTKAALSKFAKFAWQRGYTDDHIGLGLEKAVQEQPRDRVMSLEEVRAVYDATFQMGSLWGPLVRMLVLTLQRRSEVAGLKWSEVDFDGECMTVAGGRTKNRKMHKTHLAPPVLADLRELRAASSVEQVFTTTGTTPVSGFSKVKERLDVLLPEDMEPWTFHDLRTAFATQMAEDGESEAVIDRILNHVASGSAPSSVARVYNRSEHLGQRRRILNRWAALVTRDEAASGNVVSLADRDRIEGDAAGGCRGAAAEKRRVRDAS